MNLSKLFAVVYLIMATQIAFAQEQHSKDYPREFCTNREISLAFGKEKADTIWRTGNLCLSVTPNLKNIKVIVYPSGGVQKDGFWYGQESSPKKTSLTVDFIESKQSGENRRMHFMKVNNLQADVYLTLFTTMDGTSLDSVAFLSYHKAQTFKGEFVKSETAGFGKIVYTKNEGDFEAGYPDETISLMRSSLLDR